MIAIGDCSGFEINLQSLECRCSQDWFKEISCHKYRCLLDLDWTDVNVALKCAQYVDCVSIVGVHYDRRRRKLRENFRREGRFIDERDLSA